MAATFASDLELRNFLAGPWIPVTEKRAVATETEQNRLLGTQKIH
jgi:hypothetical protein